MMLKGKVGNTIKYIILIATIACCLCLFCGCHVFPWYIPKEYSDEKKAEIYDYINDSLLTELNNYIVWFNYTDPADGSERDVNIWKCGGKIIMSFDLYSERGESVYYDGILKWWDKANQAERISTVSIDEFQYLFDHVNNYASYLKTVVGTDYDDGYFWRCLPWRFGMAQIYYTVDCSSIGVSEASLSASWTVQQKGPVVSDATFNFSSDIGGINLELYAEAYNIDERIQNILSNYEKSKSDNDEINMSDRIELQ